MLKSVDELKIKIFADGADLASMLEMNAKSYIQGLTTNPTLMRKAGITDYEQFAKSVLKEITEKPISFEVFSDDLSEMNRQGTEIASWGKNVYVKIPITTTLGESTVPVIKYLISKGVKVNVTALMTLDQVLHVSEVLDSSIPSYVSIFAGRIADTGRNPVPIMKEAIDILKKHKLCELIWASPRELLNLIQADEIGCHIITATHDILKKMELIGYDLNAYSLDTVKMFNRDALEAGYSL